MLLKAGRLLKLAAAAAALVLSFPVCPSALAANAPRFKRLAPLSVPVTSPMWVSVDSDGRLYIIDAADSSLNVCSPTGQFCRKVEGLLGSIQVAAYRNGKAYISNIQNQSVEVINVLKSQTVGALGVGKGEFLKPGGIALDADDNIYVADRDGDAVKVYNPERERILILGGKGTDQFSTPIDLAVDKNSGELIVLDRPKAQTENGAKTGTRIQIFDLIGTPLRSFDNYSLQNGGLGQAQSVAVDGEGRIYVSDSRFNIVQVFDSEGTYLSTIFDQENPLRSPLGISFCLLSNRLFIASKNTGAIEIYGIDDYKTDVGELPLGGVVSTSAEKETDEVVPANNEIGTAKAGGGGGNKGLGCFIRMLGF